MKINAIGCWAVRLVLVIGAVVAAIVGRVEATAMIACMAFLSFLFLGTDD